MNLHIWHRIRGHKLRRYERRWSTTGRCGIECGGIIRGIKCSCGEIWEEQ